MIVLLVLAGCESDGSQEPSSSTRAAPISSSASASNGIDVVIEEGTPPTSLPTNELYPGGGVRGSIINKDGCLAAQVEGNTDPFVLYFPAGTELIPGGARRMDGTEYTVGMKDVSIWGMPVGPKDPDYPSFEHRCLADGGAVLLIFKPSPGPTT